MEDPVLTIQEPRTGPLTGQPRAGYFLQHYAEKLSEKTTAENKGRTDVNRCS